VLDLEKPVAAMKKKLLEYFEKACKKSVYSSAAFLDPRIKNNFAKMEKSTYQKVRKQFEEDLKPFEKSFAESIAGQSGEEEDSWTSKIFKKRKVK